MGNLFDDNETKGFLFDFCPQKFSVNGIKNRVQWIKNGVIRFHMTKKWLVDDDNDDMTK